MKKDLWLATGFYPFAGLLKVFGARLLRFSHNRVLCWQVESLGGHLFRDLSPSGLKASDLCRFDSTSHPHPLPNAAEWEGSFLQQWIRSEDFRTETCESSSEIFYCFSAL